MKKVLFLIALSTICAVCFAQNEERKVAEVAQTAGVEVGEGPMSSIGGIMSMLADPQNVVSTDTTDAGKSKEVLVSFQGPSKFLHKNYMRQSLDVSPSVSVGKATATNEMLTYDDKETSSTGWGLNFGYSLLFVPGREKEGMLKINPLGFAYGIGYMASFSQSDRYGTCCSFLGKFSIELGSFRSMGVGFDLLGGGGKTAGDVFIFSKGIIESETADKVVPYTEWCWQYGAQIWMKVNLFGSLMKNVETLVFARLVESVDPKVMSEASQFTYNMWKGETWFFGTTIRYSF